MKKFIFLSLFFGFLFQTAFSQWELQMPKPAASNLIDVAVLSPTVAVVIGPEKIFRTTDAGETYLPVEVNHSGSFSSVYATDNPEVAWLATGLGQVFRSTNAGEDWVEVKGADEIDYSSFYALNDSNAWISEPNRFMFVTTDAGNHWDTITTGLDYGFEKFLFINDTVAFAIPLISNTRKDISSVLLRTVNGGVQWDTIVVNGSGIKLLESYKESTVWYADKNKLYTSNDAGNTWAETDLPVHSDVGNISLSAISSNEFSVLLHYSGDWATFSTIFSTQDGGANWEKEYAAHYSGMWPPPYDPAYFYTIENNFGISYAVGGYSHILVKKENNDWIMKSKNILGELRSMSFIDANTGFGVGYGPYLLKTVDGGKTWESPDTLPNLSQNNFKVWFSDLTTGFVLDFEGGLFKTTNGGNTWRNVLSDSGKYSDFFFVNKNLGWLLKIDGTLYKTTNAGESWSKSITLEPAGHEWMTLFFKNQHMGFATYNLNNISQEAGGIVKIEDGTITAISGIEHLETVFNITCSNNETLWAACSKGLIYKSTDNGVTWQAVDQLFGNGWHPVYDILFTSSSKGYALCDLYGLYQTEDAGEHWSLDSTCLLNGFMDLEGMAFNGKDLFVYAKKTIAKNSGIVGVDEMPKSGQNELTVWPNPATDGISISTPGTMTKIMVINAEGKEIISQSLQTKKYILNIGKLPAGIYFIKANTENGDLSGKFIKE